jgi:hypothetical protein
VPLSTTTAARAEDAIIALQNIREQYKDVLVVLDFVTILDIAAERDYDDTEIDLIEKLPEDTLKTILWHLGKYVGSNQNSKDILPAIIQFTLAEYERRSKQ